jgi:hypothetical protein
MCRLDQKEPRKSSLHVYFKYRRLRFGFHGICASLAFVITSAALLMETTRTANETSILSSVFTLTSVLFNSMTAYQARQLLDQVPLQTEIVAGSVVAPHREAFKRTMSIMHYANLRILGCMFLNTTNNTILYKLFLSCFIYNKFLPRGSFDNGNTWIFVIPMFLGTTLDVCQYTCFSPSGVLGISHYLLIEWSALAIAFFFTLAFRGYFSVFQIYVVSAVAVATLFGGGLYILMSSILMMS